MTQFNFGDSMLVLCLGKATKKRIIVGNRIQDKRARTTEKI